MLTHLVQPSFSSVRSGPPGACHNVFLVETEHPSRASQSDVANPLSRATQPPPQLEIQEAGRGLRGFPPKKNNGPCNSPRSALPRLVSLLWRISPPPPPP
eukprot:Hpha_TRINITY_DN15899_c1_g11::TRINITY_DN15899_c1_g11_i1::g.190874::m.190874